jgi:DNA-directed RNA polymerase specialized sigma subunit
MRVTVDETELEALVQQLRDGDDSVSGRIILHFIGLTRSLSRHAVARHPEKADDIRAVAAMWLVKAVRQAPKRMYNNNIGPYITSTVRMGIREYLQRDHILRIPKDAWAKMVESLKLDELDDYLRLKTLRELKKFNMVFQASIPDGRGGFLEDFIGVGGSQDEQAICHFDQPYLIAKEIRLFLKLTEFENVVLNRRLEGYTLKEIGAQLNTSYVTVHNTLKKIQTRYRTIQRAHPTLPEPPDGI